MRSEEQSGTRQPLVDQTASNKASHSKRFYQFLIMIFTAIISAVILYRLLGIFSGRSNSVAIEPRLGNLDNLSVDDLNSSPIVIGTIPDQVAMREQPFNLALNASEIFFDPNGDGLVVKSDLEPYSWVSLSHDARTDKFYNLIDGDGCGGGSPPRSIYKDKFVYSICSGRRKKQYDNYVEYGRLFITNIKNPSHPFLEGLYDEEKENTRFSSIGLDTNYAYITTSDLNQTPTVYFQVVNITDLSHISAVGSYEVGKYTNKGWSTKTVAVSKNFAFFGEVEVGLQVINITNPTNPTLLSSYHFQPDISVNNLAVTEHYIYVSTSKGLQILDYTDPLSLQLVDIYGKDYTADVVVSNDLVYLAFYNRIEILSILNASKPNLIQQIMMLNGGALGGFGQIKNNSILAHDQGTQIIDIHDIKKPNIFPTNTFDNKGIFAREKNYVFILETTTDTQAPQTGILYSDLRSIIFTGRPQAKDVGFTTISVIAGNYNGRVVETHFNIQVNSIPPKIGKTIPDQIAPIKEMFNYTLPKNIFSSIYSDPLTYSVHFENAQNDWSIPGFSWGSSWLSFNPEKLCLTGIPGRGDTSGIKVSLTAHDLAKKNNTLTFIINVSGASYTKLLLTGSGLLGVLISTTLLILKYTFTVQEQIKKISRSNKKLFNAPISTLTLIPPKDLNITTRLGSGGFGEVYAGQWGSTGVAIKKLYQNHLNPDSLSHLYDEITIMSSLRHPNIVTIYGVNTDNDQQLSIVMELVAEGSLYQLLHCPKPLSESAKVQIAIDTAYGLKYLHEHNIVHCDIKSMNVLLDAKLHAKLTDFGLAQFKQTVNEAAGTVPWMAPELFGENPACTKASDIYSFGMLLWELVTEKIPFSHANNKAVLKQWIKSGKQEQIPEDCDDLISQLITACWQVNPLLRPRIQDIIWQLKEYETSLKASPAQSIKEANAQQRFFRSEKSTKSNTGSELLSLLEHTDASDNIAEEFVI